MSENVTDRPAKILSLPDPAESDLDWQAFLYVSGEMSPAESAAFERQLEENQAVREAVARSVKMLETMTIAPAVVAEVKMARKRTSRWNIVAVIATVAALVLVSLVLVPSPNRQSGERARDLVSLWAESEDLPEEGLDAEGSVALTNGEGSELIVPGWMLAAVRSDSKNKPEED